VRAAKRSLSLLLALALLLPLCVRRADAAGGDVQSGNFLRITTAAGFSAGSAEQVAVAADRGDGALVLAPGAADGVWTSAELTVPAFEYLVASWSADTPAGTTVEISARAFVDAKNGWSGWLSWGVWSPWALRACTDQKDALAEIDTDTFTVLGTHGETASRLQLRAALHTDAAGATPVLCALCATLKNTLDGQAIPVWPGDGGAAALPAEAYVSAAPAISQMVRDPAIADRICSPTSVTMMLNARGEDLLPEEVALREYDFCYQGFGNWSFSVAMGGACGYDSFCHYGDLDFLRRELAAGRTVALSVKYSSSPNGEYPYLENAAIPSTGGHLITLAGYGTENGVAYFYSNDSAASSDGEAARRRYRADQLDQAWSGRLCYVMSAEKEAGAGEAAPARVAATLGPVQDGVCALLADGAPVTGLAADFSAKTSLAGAGTVLLIPDGAADTAGAQTASCLATHTLRYLSLDGSGAVRVGDAPAGTVYVIVNNGPTYVAHYDPAAPQTAPEPETARPAAAAAVPVWIWAALAAAVLALSALLILRRGRRKK